MSDLMLDVGQANELKFAMRRAGMISDEVKRMSEGDFMKGVAGLLRGEYELTPIAKTVATALLIAVGTVDIAPTTDNFVASEKFVVNTKADAKVKISYLGDNFKSWFLEKVEQPIAGSELHYHKLENNSLDVPIITELGGEGKAETTLTEMFSLMEKQTSGKAGMLLTNGYSNIFYIRDAQGVLRTVNVHWHDGGWRVHANDIGLPGAWYAVDQVFSRNSVTL